MVPRGGALSSLLEVLREVLPGGGRASYTCQGDSLPEVERWWGEAARRRLGGGGEGKARSVAATVCARSPISTVAPPRGLDRGGSRGEKA